MAITAVKLRKMKTAARPKAPGKRETYLLSHSDIADMQLDKNGRWPFGRRMAIYTYDFSVDGGSHTTNSGVITPASSVTIPANAIITEVFVHVVTAVTSGGSATVSCDLAAGGDMLGATAKASLTLNAVLTGLPQGNSTTDPAPIRLAADTTPTVTVGTADLTAGKIRVYVSYLYPNL